MSGEPLNWDRVWQMEGNKYYFKRSLRLWIFLSTVINYFPKKIHLRRLTGFLMLFSFSMSEASLTDVKATHFTDFFFICVRYAVCDRCFSVTDRIIKYWCVNIYSVLAFWQLDCSHTKFPNQTITISKPHKHHLHKHCKRYLQTPSPGTRNTISKPNCFNPCCTFISSQEKIIDAETISMYITLLVHIHKISLWKGFNGFLMAGSWKKLKIMSVLTRYFCGRYRQ